MAGRKKSDPETDSRPDPEETDNAQSREVEAEVEIEAEADPDAAPDYLPEPQPADAVPHDESGAGENPDPAPLAESQPAPQPAIRQGGFLPALLGGLIAATLGFAAGRSAQLDSYLPAFLQNGTATALADLRSEDQEQAATLTALRNDLDSRPVIDSAAIEAAIASLKDETARNRADSDAIRADLTTVRGGLEPLAVRLTELEKRPLAENVSAEAREAYERELAALRAEVQKMVETARAAETQARTREGNAATAADLARNHAMIARLRAALDQGVPYAPILADLSKAGLAVPDILTITATEGVDSAAALLADFPPAARAALAATRAEDAGSGGFGGFLRRQLGARSVEPRDGDSADAVLSRAEAAAVGGDLDAALAEIATLPAAAQSELATWVDRATARNSALAAADALAQSLNSN